MLPLVGRREGMTDLIERLSVKAVGAFRPPRPARNDGIPGSRPLVHHSPPAAPRPAPIGRSSSFYDARPGPLGTRCGLASRMGSIAHSRHAPALVLALAKVGRQAHPRLPVPCIPRALAASRRPACKSWSNHSFQSISPLPRNHFPRHQTSFRRPTGRRTSRARDRDGSSAVAVKVDGGTYQNPIADTKFPSIRLYKNDLQLHL